MTIETGFPCITSIQESEREERGALIRGGAYLLFWPRGWALIRGRALIRAWALIRGNSVFSKFSPVTRSDPPPPPPP